MTMMPLWMKIAYQYLGTLERPGAANNPVIVDMYALSGNPGVKHDSVPWCAAFVGACLRKAGHTPTGSLMARSYEKWGLKLNDPFFGAVGVKSRAGGAAWQGHVGFVVGATKDRIFLLGGNQGDAVSVASFPRRDFTAYRWPESVPLKGIPKLATSIAGAITSPKEA